jgi:hypothetical protein
MGNQIGFVAAMGKENSEIINGINWYYRTVEEIQK